MTGITAVDIAMILGITEFAKKFGLSGNWVILFTVLLAFGFGVGADFAATNAQFAFWYDLVAKNLAIALSAAGLYDAGKRALVGAQTAIRQITFK
jgi:hypothetical protein